MRIVRQTVTVNRITIEILGKKVKKVTYPFIIRSHLVEIVQQVFC